MHISLIKGLACHEYVNSRLKSLALARAILFSEGAPELDKDRAFYFLKEKKKVYYVKKKKKYDELYHLHLTTIYFLLDFFNLFVH